MIVVLRIGHRIERDKRVTTHVALVARAFGANGIYIDTRDIELEKRIESVSKRFGGDFWIKTGTEWKKLVKEWHGKIIHLTMYGRPVSEVIHEIRQYKDIMIVVGSEKVPRAIFDVADYNVAIGNQPHSEVAALALFLDRYTSGTWENKRFDGIIEVIPMEKGKKVVHRNLPSPEECIELLKKAGCSKEVIAHCRAVRDVAMKIAECIKTADKRLVEVGALLHDIGRSKTHGITHGIEGAKIAKEMNLPEEVVRIIERHLGAGIPREEAEKLGLPPKDYIPETIEEKIVAHADNLIENNRPIKIEEEINKQLNKGNINYARRLKMLHDELSKLCGKDLNILVQ
ncbi:MAG TPA: TIGR00295 family protein [Thermoplasmatales archaeon]|nr:TIGR00295 family protein [Thermoplasmatales archaeon]